MAKPSLFISRRARAVWYIAAVSDSRARVRTLPTGAEKFK